MIALEILKACRERGQKRAGGLDLDEAISELEAINLTRREWYQKGFNEAMKQGTCEGCKYFRKNDKACFLSSIRPASIDFIGCSKHEPKDNEWKYNY